MARARLSAASSNLFSRKLLDGRQSQSQVFLGIAEEARWQSLGEQLAASFLGVQQPAVRQGRHVEIGVIVLDDVNLPPREVELAGEGEQLEEEKTLCRYRSDSP